MTFKHLLVPLDGLPLSEAVVPIASLLARTDHARVTLLYVATSDALANAATSLKEAARVLEEAGLAVSTFRVRAGDPADQIVHFAQAHSADLIVMATHGRTGLRRTVLGSVADRVMHSTHLPLVLLHPNKHQVRSLRTILVPVDGTPGGAVALMTAAPLARVSGAKLILARATVPLPVWLYDPTLGLDTGPLIDRSWDEQERWAAEAYAEGLAAKLRHAGWVAEGVGVSGEPGHALTHLANEVDADLIVMSTSAMTGAIRSVLGSVAGDVVREAQRPVLLVRRTHLPLSVAAAVEKQMATPVIAG